MNNNLDQLKEKMIAYYGEEYEDIIETLVNDEDLEVFDVKTVHKFLMTLVGNRLDGIRKTEDFDRETSNKIFQNVKTIDIFGQSMNYETHNIDSRISNTMCDTLGYDVMMDCIVFKTSSLREEFDGDQPGEFEKLMTNWVLFHKEVHTEGDPEKVNQYTGEIVNILARCQERQINNIEKSYTK